MRRPSARSLVRYPTDRDALREAYRRASRATRDVTREELEELDHLADDGLD